MPDQSIQTAHQHSSPSDKDISRQLLKIYEIFGMFDSEPQQPQADQSISVKADNKKPTR